LLLLGIKRRGSSSAEELAGGAYLSAGAARQHLTALEMQGFVEHVDLRSGPGRPRHVFRLTQMGEELFPQAYMGVANQLMNALVHEDEGVRNRVLANTVGIPFRVGNGSESARERLPMAVESLSDYGYFPEVTGSDGKGAQLTFSHCPLLELARAHPEICAIEQKALAEALSPARTEREEWRLSGATHCRYKISY
jgi:DeoR family suf operon transcriptional repressor